MAEELSFKEKIKTLQVMTRSGRGPAVREYRDPDDGHRIKKTRTELGHVVTEHADGRVSTNVYASPAEIKWVKPKSGEADSS